jgi:spore coat polysaccharide biosynthesis protein SpsF
MIELMAERVLASEAIDKVVIATSNLPSDDPLEALAEKIGIGCYRGSLENVMDRIVNAAEAYDCDTIVELLGDNPLVHSELIDDVVRYYRDSGYDYAATVTREYPVSEIEKKLFSIGVRVQVYSSAIAQQSVDYPAYFGDEDKHPTAYIFERPEKYKVGYFEARGKWAFMNRPALTFAVNYRKNVNLIRAIFEKNYPEDTNFPLERVYQQLDLEKYLYILMGAE